jgi:hypothetical protein
MTGSKPNFFFVLCWYIISPCFIFGIWIFSWIEYTPITYGKYQYSTGAITFGWCISLVSIIAIPAGAIHTLIKSPEKSFFKVIFSYLIYNFCLNNYFFLILRN